LKESTSCSEILTPKECSNPVDERRYITFRKVGIRQDHKEHCFV